MIEKIGSTDGAADHIRLGIRVNSVMNICRYRQDQRAIASLFEANDGKPSGVHTVSLDILRIGNNIHNSHIAYVGFLR